MAIVTSPNQGKFAAYRSRTNAHCQVSPPSPSRVLPFNSPSKAENGYKTQVSGAKRCLFTCSSVPVVSTCSPVSESIEMRETDSKFPIQIATELADARSLPALHVTTDLNSYIFNLSSEDNEKAEEAMVSIIDMLTSGQVQATDIELAAVIPALVPRMSVPGEESALALDCLFRLVSQGTCDSNTIAPALLRILDIVQNPCAHVPSTYFAVSVLLRLAERPDTGVSVIRAGGLESLVGTLKSTEASVAQISVFALLKLTRVGDLAANLAALLASGCFSALVMLLQQCSDTLTREMAGALLLELTALPQCPDYAAKNGLMKGLVDALSRPVTPDVAQVSLLAIARLAHLSPACQMDAVREGVLVPLMAMLGAGSASDQLHACRLLAIVCQATPTHGHVRAAGALPAIKLLLESELLTVAEHAANVVAVLAQNPDTHFELVNLGFAPILVALLSRKKNSCPPKLVTYVLASLMLLATQEARHAAVLVRCGVLPHVIRLVSDADNATDSVLEYAVATLAALTRVVSVQEEVIEHGAITMLADIMAMEGAEAKVHAAEGLANLVGTGAMSADCLNNPHVVDSMLAGLRNSNQPELQARSSHLMLLVARRNLALLEGLDTKGLGPAIVQGLTEGPWPAAGAWTSEEHMTKVSLAWLVSELCSLGHTQATSLLDLGVVRPLLAMLIPQPCTAPRESGSGVPDGSIICLSPEATAQALCGVSKYLHESRVAAATAALLAVARCGGPAARHAVRAELALLSWNGIQVELAGLDAPDLS